jgi:hypothetical protein
LELQKTIYHQVEEQTHLWDFPRVLAAAWRIHKELDELGHTRWAAECRRLCGSSAPHSMLSKVSVTIKTHKPPGKVRARMIHASPSGIVRALARVAHIWLSEKLQAVRHLCKDSREIIALLDSTVIANPEAVLLKLDVDQFYLSGGHMELISLVGTEFSGRQKKALEDILWTVMGYQLVTTVDGTMHRVQIGSGMGGVQSGAVSDLAFLVQVESRLPKAGMLLYSRFRDDVFVVLENQAVAESFQTAFRQLASPTWQVSVDEVSSYSVAMLDLLVYKGPRFKATGRLDYAPYTKPSSRHQPLATTSAP